MQQQQPPEEAPNLKVLSFDKDENIKKTKFDIKHKGSNYHLRIDACEQGFKIMYLLQVNKVDYTPAPFKSMVPPDEKAYVTVGEVHAHEPNWLLRSLGWTLEKKTYKEIRTLRKELVKSLQLVGRAAQFNSDIEKEDYLP